MAWCILVVAGVCERLGDRTQIHRRFHAVVAARRDGGVDAGQHRLAWLGLAMKTLPVGTAYVVRIGIGAVGTLLLGMLLFGEPATPLRLASAALIVAGLVVLKLAA